MNDGVVVLFMQRMAATATPWLVGSARPCNGNVVHSSFPAGTFAAAGYWARLSLSTNAPASSVEIRRNAFFTWVEYSNMRLSDSPSPEDSLVSFQIVLPNGETPFFMAIYGTSGTSADGRLASVGAYGCNGAFRKSYCCREAGRIADGMMLYIDPGYGSDPLAADTDLDGLTDGEEAALGTDPANADTDGDGVDDGAEVAQSSDPGDATDGGVPGSRIPVPFTFGDPSGSHSEKYRLEIEPVEGEGARPSGFSWLNESYGQCETKTAMLKPGWRYAVRLNHAGTPRSTTESRAPTTTIRFRWP